ncbi:TonB-dependent receptor [Massilia sp. Dwa41.01b]|uniref:TonB-dependent receptor n=1 Tax=unclassified Massilia TaxID=2609279 RepID=UPI001603EA8B|nr:MULTISPECIES: TonB-dependent receptor [unclassified Massilia]QNA90805.1 TonB-dependent receptor [Massilia sp. Dwa41.01b]QNA98043.1 TonB-dependent receptor [Massilia sp. Se16.2.3]
MTQSKQFMLSATALAVLALVGQARAQTTDQTAAQDAPSAAVTREIQQVVVTGTASASGTRKIDTAFSITTANEEQLKSASPSSTADVLKLVPGVYAEATGGQSGANVEVRGFPSGSDSPFVSVQLNGNPIYPVPVLSFFEGTSAFRLDDTIERVEVLRGGPSTIYSVGQPGATMNFILKKGDDVAERSIRLTTGTGRLRRGDLFVGGKIADGWYGSFGGFYRKTQGVRDPQFAADDGGQLTGTLTRKLEGGELTFYVRATDDKNAFYTGVPLISSNEGRSISAFPGFDPLTGTLMSNEMRHFTIDAAPGKTLERDLAEGRGMKAAVWGANYEQRIAGWDVSNKANYFSGDLNTISMFTGNNPLSAGAYLAAANATHNPGAPATSGSMTYVNGGAAVDPNQQIVQAGLWSVEKKLSSFTNELRVSRELFPGHTVTAGGYYANYKSDDEWYLGNSHLMTATPNARLIDVSLSNGTIVSRGGKEGNVFYAPVAHYKGNNLALFLADEWKISDRLRVDAGLRRERQSLEGSVSNLTSGDTDNNPLTVYNNGTSMATGNYTRLERDDSVNSFTVGGLYKLTKDASVFVRANTGHTFIYFDDMRNAGTQAALNDRNGVPNPKVTQYEVGFKTANSLYSAYINAFYTDFTGISFQQITTDAVLNSVSGSRGHGVEFELALRPVKNLQLTLTGDYQKSTYRDNPAISGNEVQRQPNLQFRFTPSYRIPFGENAVKLYGTYTHVGDRWADQANLSYLPSYQTVDIGALATFGDKWELRLSATNLTNELGLTEGNSRLTGAQSSGPINARPIFGRAVEASLLYRF